MEMKLVQKAPIIPETIDVLDAILDAYEEAGWTRPEEIDVDPLEVEPPEES